MRIRAMSKSLRRAFLTPAIGLFATVAVFGGAPRPVAAEDWPTRPITLVIASTAGGMMDVISRSIAQDLSATLGQPVIVARLTIKRSLTGRDIAPGERATLPADLSGWDTWVPAGAVEHVR